MEDTLKSSGNTEAGELYKQKSELLKMEGIFVCRLKVFYIP